MKNNLEQILNCLREANAEGMIVDTIWMDDGRQTLFDFIELCIEEAALTQQQEAEPVADNQRATFETALLRQFPGFALDEIDAGAVALSRSIWQSALTQQRDDTHGFKNFHRSLCDRFGYVHDEIDWSRDQVSLIEHIATLTQQQEAEPYGYLRENDGAIQISIGSERPADRSGGYATPWVAIYARPPNPAAQPTMDDAIATGNGTLHGAIDYWQQRALKAEAALPQVPEGCPPDIEVREAVADFMRDTQTLPLDHCARRLVIKIKQMLSAAKEEGK